MKQNFDAKARLLSLHAHFGTWRDVANKLQINAGVLNAVARGKRNPPRKLVNLLTGRRISDMSTKELAKLLKERS